MRGVPEDNYPAFTACAKALREQGHTVVNPAEHFGGDRGLPRHKYLAADVVALLGCGGIVLLQGWGASEGARLEAQIALDRGFTFFRWDAFRGGLMPARVSDIEEVLA